VSAKAKPKRARVRHEDLEVLDAKPTGGKVVRAHGDGLEPKPTDNGKIRRRRNPARTDLLKTLPEARQRVFERHYPELAKAEKTRRRKARNKKAI
jgi:hypothetical protein